LPSYNGKVWYKYRRKIKYKPFLGTVLLGACCVLASCTGSQDAGKNEVRSEEQTVAASTVTASDSSTRVSSVSEASASKDSVSFLVEVSEEEETGTPMSNISLVANEQTIQLKKVPGQISVYGKEDFERMDIPQEALAACGGWWAGAGSYFYVLKSPKEGLLVYEGWADEGSDTEGYHWKKLKVLD
jgi:hypothetical protein